MTTPIYPTTWYFIVGDTNPTTQVYDTAGAAFVANTAAAYQAWVATLGPGPRQPITAPIVNVQNNGAGLIRITLDTANGPTPTSIYATGNVRVVQGVGGTTEANGTWTITVVDSTNIDLQGSTFTHAYTSGGVFGGGDVIGTVAAMATLLEQFGLTVFIESITSGWGYSSIVSGVNVQLTEPVSFFNDVLASADISVTLPPVNVTGTSLIPGRPIRFRNKNNANQVSIRRSGGTVLANLPPFAEVEVVNQGNSPITDAGGNWAVSIIGTNDAAGTDISSVTANKFFAASTSSSAQTPFFRFLDASDLTAMTSPPIGVPVGGTGALTLTAHGVLLGAGTSPIAATAVMTNGQLLVGQTGADPLPKTISGDWTLNAAGVATLGSTIAAAGPIGDASHVAQITYDAKGRLTTVSAIAISLDAAAIASGTLPVGRGGTGDTTLTAHGILLGEGTSPIGTTAAMADGQLLVGQTGADPLPKTITGDWTLSAAGAATLGNVPAAVTIAGAATVQGDLLYASAAATLARLAKNATATRYLANTGTSNNPAWDQVNLGNGITGTLPVANGGTNYAGAAWPTYTATLTPNVGSITNGGSSGALQVGKWVTVNIAVTVAAISGGPANVTLTLPVAPLRSIFLIGRENANTGDRISAPCNAGNTTTLAFRDLVTNAVRAPALNDLYVFDAVYEAQ